MPALQDGGRHTINPAEIAVLTLTYGDRSSMLAQMIAGVAAEGVQTVFVYANGLAPAPAARLQALTQRDDGVSVQVIHSERNVGSAAGYADLIEAAAVMPGLDGVWFLDDDNVPRPGALAELLAAQARVGGAVAAVRTDRAYLIESARRGFSTPPRSGEAFGVDIRTRPLRAWGKVMQRLRPSAKVVRPEVRITRVPYGGLLVPREQMVRIAAPRREFVLYADDYEYSERLHRDGGLHLVGAAMVDDLEASWNATRAKDPAAAPQKRGQLWRLAQITPDFRLYYALRNAVWLDRARVTALTVPVFAVNVGWLVLSAALRAMWLGRPANARVIVLAVWHGLTGQLGLNAEFPLPT